MHRGMPKNPSLDEVIALSVCFESLLLGFHWFSLIFPLESHPDLGTQPMWGGGAVKPGTQDIYIPSLGRLCTGFLHSHM